MPRSKKHNSKYSPEFKISVIMDMREHGLSYKATMRKYFSDFSHKELLFSQAMGAHISDGRSGSLYGGTTRTRSRLRQNLKSCRTKLLLL